MMKSRSSTSHSKIYVKVKDKWLPLLIGFILVFLTGLLAYVNPKPVEKWTNLIENLSYDFQVRSHPRPLKTENPIVIIDIDDKSLKAQGRWPWSRKILADLVSKLFKAGATIVALDITFPDAEENVISEAIVELNKVPKPNKSVINDLEGVRKAFDYDIQFASSLSLGESVLGFVFSDQGAPSGIIPPPILTLDRRLQDELAIPDMSSFLGNVPVLQNAAKNGGFINATKDLDGVQRFTNLLLRRGSDVYVALSLQAVSMFLLTKKIELITENYKDAEVLEGIKLDQLTIPTDSMGRILIPFRGPAFTLPYVSATDVLEGKVERSSIEGKLIFIGFSASALGDLYATSIDPVFPGVEIHATIALGIFDHYLPYKPSWGKGVILFLVVLCGFLCALLLPFSGAIACTLLSLVLTAGIVLLDRWMWSHHGIVLAILIPLLLIWMLYIFNMAWGYLTESKRGKELKSVFGQYVPPAYLEEMMQKGGGINLEGESKEMSVLFSDIRSFTNLSEKMTASELKKFLNQFFNPITEVIFNNKGTIDKYVGDMVMAFWGAPLDNPKHAYQAVNTALEMLEKLAELNLSFQKENKPAIRIGIGINTGLMNVGDMGSRFRRSYTVIGDAVNLASRLEGQGKYYQVDTMVGEDTWQQTKDAFVYRKIDKIKVVGKDKGIDVYQPICRTEHLTEDLRRELEIHHQALAAYFLQDWKTAANLFEELKNSHPHHAELYKIYLGRIVQLRLQPHKKFWDGSYVSLEK